MINLRPCVTPHTVIHTHMYTGYGVTDERVKDVSAFREVP